MTPTNDDAVAQRIAERGRDALLERLRPAFEEAAEAQADLIELDADEFEDMVQRAADRADGLQWRRALASVAMEELGIGLGDALSHPAVARAQTIVGAPSYEDSFAELVAERDRGTTEKRPQAEVASDDAEELPPATDPTTLQVIAAHVGGIAGLAPYESGLELELSEHGLDISRAGDVVGRLPWQEIQAIEVPPPRGRWRRRQHDAQMVIRTAQGTATFSIPALTPDEFRELVAPVIAHNRP